MNEIFVTGHRNPDTDSIVAAMSYAALRNALGDRQYVAAHLGHISDETNRMLKHFGFNEPMAIRTVRTQVRDLEYDTPPCLSSSVTMDRAWHVMREQRISAVPVVNDDGTLYGMLSAGDIATFSMETLVDSQVEDALLQKALGYESIERKVEVSAKGERKEVSTVKQVGPDVSAISLWLKKRRPEQWGDGESVQALPESNLLTLLSWERGELDGISELQPTAEADHDLVEPQGVPRTGRSDL